MHVQIEPSILYFGTPVVLITSENEDSSINVAPNSSVFWLGWSCMIGIDATSKTTENIKRTGCCVLNMPSFEMADSVNAVAMLTGSRSVPIHKKILGYRFKKDKLEGSGMTTVPATAVSGARIVQCPVQLEAEVIKIHAFAEKDPRMGVPATAIEFRIKAVHVDECILLVGEKDKIDPLKWNPLIMSFRRFFGLSESETRSKLFSGSEDLYAPWKMAGLFGTVARSVLRLSRSRI